MPAFQLFITDDTLGALNPHSSRPNAFDDTSISVGGTVATHATIAVIAAQREEQFRAAMTSRDIISHTKGILMEHFSVDADRAFGPLRALSQRLQRTARRNHSASLPKPNIRPSPDTLRNRRLPRRDTPRAQGSACR
ncbi:ANTAR domain-containing protein [Rhodococcus indonesiensis]